MRSLIVLGVVLTVTIAGLAAGAVFLGTLSSGSSQGDSIQRQPLTIVTAEGKIERLDVEIADTEQKRTVGLSGRESIPADTGMLFIIPERGPGFWMKDTLVPLSVAFLSRCGEIVDIQDMQPLSLDIHSTSADYSFGLETPQGWFTQHGVKVGDLVSIPRGYRLSGC